jgi:hypothetical protein
MTWPPRPPTPPHLRTYGWFRRYRGFVTHKKWRAIANMTGLHLTVVIAVQDALQEAANDGRPRGSLADFSIVEWAAALDLDSEVVARVYAAMEELGAIDDEYLIAWDKRQKPAEDPTNAERQRRHKAKKRRERLSTGNGGNGVTLVTVTTRPDKLEEAAKDPPVETVDNPTQWLGEEGLAMVCRNGKLLRSQGQLVIARWRRDLAGDDEALRRIILGSVLAADGRFLNVVAEALARHRREAAEGGLLPLGPVKLRAADGEG